MGFMNRNTKDFRHPLCLRKLYSCLVKVDIICSYLKVNISNVQRF